jgi:protein-S-isoprenylcysteine O-methyltransferase Ste14
MEGIAVKKDTLSYLRRIGGLVFGFGNQFLFLITVWYLFWFLRDGSLNEKHDYWMIVDIGLATIFAVTHSLLLAPWFRRRLGKWIPAPFYDSFFCTVTCISLLLLFFQWRTSSFHFWSLSGWPAFGIHLCFYGSWIALLYSLALTGLGYQNGWTPFYYWLRNQKLPRREFVTRGAYKYLRHPVYLSFLGLIWFTPRMSLDHAVLTAVWSFYIFIGSVLKDQRLSQLIGPLYRKYSEKVPGYPFMLLGPLARWKPMGREEHYTLPIQVDRKNETVALPK